MDNSDTDMDEITMDIQLGMNALTLAVANSLLDSYADKMLLVNKLRGFVTDLKWSPEDATDLFDALLERFESSNDDRSQFLPWLMEMLHCMEIHLITPSWTCQNKTMLELVRDRTVTDPKLKEHFAENTEKQLDEIIREIQQQRMNQMDDKLLDEVKDIVSSVCKDLASQNGGSQQRGIKGDLFRLCEAVEKVKKYRPRLTQMVSWCVMALSKTGQLIQVATGEGKSCIIAMFAAYQAIKGKTVDILTSSPVLAERDWKDWCCFFVELKISVDCNTDKHDNRALQECYKSQVVYGIVEKFAGDLLTQRFEKMETLGRRAFQCAIVDEVDSLMLDKALHTVYIGGNIPALQYLNPLLAFIWATVNQYSEISTGLMVGKKYLFPDVALKVIKDKETDIFKVLEMAEDVTILPKGSGKDLGKNLKLLTSTTASLSPKQLADFFIMLEKKFPCCQLSLHCINNNGSIEKLNEGQQRETERAERKGVPLLLTDGGFCQYMYWDKNSLMRAIEEETESVLCFTPCETTQNKSIYVPGFLSELVKSNLKVWIKNALLAQTMTADHEYVIERHGKVVPVDFSSTGVIENFMVMSGGLQQFLEMKHGSKLGDMTAITNYMSNTCLLQKYGNQIFGVTGTIGQQAETEILWKLYGIKTCQIATFKRRKLFEVEGVIAVDETEWLKEICNVVKAQIHPTQYRGKRAVLVICETIKRSKSVYQALRAEVPALKLYVSNNMDNTLLFARSVEPGDVIIATNLAGRGTDLKVCDQVNAAGGLFVVQAFLPENARVEAQAFGRTARQGSPGSAQLIVCCSHLPEPLKMLAFCGKLQSSLGNLSNAAPEYQFLLQFTCYHRSHSNDKSKLLFALYRLLTKTLDPETKEIKDGRDHIAAVRLSSFLDRDIPEIKKKGELFEQYLHVRDEMFVCSKPAETDVSALDEFWGLWLLVNEKGSDSPQNLTTKLTKDLETAMQKLKKRKSPSANLHHYTAFGNELRKKGHLAESIKMYTEAIQQDQCWAAFAYYNRAFTSLLQKNRHRDQNCIGAAMEDLQHALKSIELYCEQTQVTRKQVQTVTGEDTRLDQQMEKRQKAFLVLRKNINKAMEELQTARDLGRFVKVQESPLIFQVPAVDIFNAVFLSIHAQGDPLRAHQLSSHPVFTLFHEFTCLKFLGLTQFYTIEMSFSLLGFLSKVFTKSH